MEKVFESTVISKLFEVLYQRGVCIRCLLRIFREENINTYREKQNYSEILCKIGQQLGDSQLLMKNYDFMNYICKTSVDDRNIDVADIAQEVEIKVPRTMRDQVIQQVTMSFSPSELDCIVCLGILQKVDKQDFLDIIINNLAKQDYEYECFKLTIKTPLAVSIRQLCATYLAAKEVKEWGQLHNLSSLEIDSLLSYYQLLSAPIDLKAAVKWLLSAQLCDQLNKKSNANDDRFLINITFENLNDDFELFKLFQECISHINEDNWQEKLVKKLKMNDPVLKEQTKDILQQKRKEKYVEPFVPSSGNLEKLAKIPSSFVTEGILVHNLIYIILNNCYLRRNKQNVNIEVKASHQNVLIKGNYIKYARFLSQTPWVINGQKIYETSIQDIIGESCVEIFKSTDIKFHSGGSMSQFLKYFLGEDIDVRMLGNGRPFVIELVDPHRAESTVSPQTIDYIFEAINKSTQVNVTNLAFTDTTCFMDLKNSETNKIKAYCCVVQTASPVTEAQIQQLHEISNLELIQKTPIRVLHRRTLLERKKTIFKLKVIKINDQFTIVYVLASAGTYIKEFIHGDLERTKPSLCQLLTTHCDIFQLDVIKLYVDCNPNSLLDFDQLCGNNIIA